MINDYDTFLQITYKSGLFDTLKKAKESLKITKEEIIEKKQSIVGEGIIKTKNCLNRRNYYYFEINTYKNSIFIKE